MAEGKNKTDGDDECVAPTELRAFMKHMTESLTLTHTRSVTQLDGIERRICGAVDRLETFETHLPLAGQDERARHDAEDQRPLHYRGNNNRDPFTLSSFHDGFCTNEYEAWEIVLDD